MNEQSILSDIIEKDKFDAQKEWLILSHCIMVDEVLSFVFKNYSNKKIRTEHFGDYFKTILKWTIDYYSEYQKAPGLNIQNIFTNAKSDLDDDYSSVIENYLDRLAEEYQLIDHNQFNIEFIIRDIIPEFIFRQELDLAATKLKTYADLANIDQEIVAKTVEGLKKISGDDDEDFGTIIPGSVLRVKKHFSSGQNRRFAMQLPGAIGRLIGPIYKSATYAITGNEKSGKTFFMTDLAFQGVMFHKLKVLDISLEMTQEDKEERFWQRIGKNFTSDPFSVGQQLVPVFDCLNNQFNECRVRKTQLNKKALLLSIDSVVEFYERPDWKICNKCRGQNKSIKTKLLPRQKRYIPAIWFYERIVKSMTRYRTEKAIEKMKHFKLSNYRLKCFPRFSANFDDVLGYINDYTAKAKFNPDLIVIDYPDIMRPINGPLMDRHNIDYNWKSCAQLAHEKNIALIIADQTSRLARNSRSIKSSDTSEDKRKDAHIDLRITLNRNDEEADLGLQRVGTLFKRKGKSNFGEVMCLQNLSLSRTMLDSEFWNHGFLRYPTVKIKYD